MVRSHGKDLFYTPGGKRERDETDHDALVREVAEELSVNIDVNSIKFANTFTAPADGKNTDTYVQMTCYFADFVGKLQPNSEIAELAWLSYSDMNRLSLAGKQLFEWLRSQQLITG